jgi:hypothetical protein
MGIQLPTEGGSRRTSSRDPISPSDRPSEGKKKFENAGLPVLYQEGEEWPSVTISFPERWVEVSTIYKIEEG